MAGESELFIERIAAEAATDALAARAMVESILRQPAGSAEFVATAITSQNSRFRQVVARAAQRVGLRDDVRSMLLQWQQTETDEFALAAISDALVSGTPRRHPKMLKDLADLGRTFRFIADRLRHKVLNAVPRTGLSINRLSAGIKEVADPRLRAILDGYLGDLRDSVARLEAAVTIDSDVDAFEPKDVLIFGWLQQFARRYISQWAGVEVNVAAKGANQAVIAAPAYLLEIIFTNLFDNARQATADSTVIELNIQEIDNDIIIRVLDNGPGFSPAAADAAFAIPVAADGGKQGRGLMEVNDAVRRIGGVPEIRDVNGRRCVHLVLPNALQSVE